MEFKTIQNAVKSVASDLSGKQEKSVSIALKELKKAYDKIQAGSGKHKMKGKGFWDWLKTAAGDVNNWLKETKLLSKVASPVLEYILPIAATAIGSPITGATAALAGKAGAEGIKALGYGKMKMKGMKGGCNACLAISPPGQRLGQRGKGMTVSYNGTYQNTSMPRLSGGGGSAFGSVSSEFGKIKV